MGDGSAHTVERLDRPHVKGGRDVEIRWAIPHSGHRAGGRPSIRPRRSVDDDPRFGARAARRRARSHEYRGTCVRVGTPTRSKSTKRRHSRDSGVPSGTCNCAIPLGLDAAHRLSLTSTSYLPGLPIDPTASSSPRQSPPSLFPIGVLQAPPRHPRCAKCLGRPWALAHCGSGWSASCEPIGRREDARGAGSALRGLEMPPAP